MSKAREHCGINPWHAVTTGLQVPRAALARRLPRLEAGFDRFFAYSMATVAVMAFGGLMTPLVVAQGWPLLGLAERIAQAGYLQWFVVAPLLLARAAR